MPRSRGKMLVIRGGAIGDFILTLPVLSALRAAFPDTHLEVLGYPRVAQLAVAAGVADATASIESRPLAGYFSRTGPVDKSLDPYFASFSVIVSYLYDPDGYFQANVLNATKAQFFKGPHRPSETENLHAAKALLKPLERLAIFNPDPEPKLPLPPTALPVGREGRWLAMHPGSGSETKNWPEENWAALICFLLEHTGLNLLLVGGEAEGNRLLKLAPNGLNPRVEIAQNLPLTGLAARLQGCEAFVGHDSGITHLAAALGLKTLALWGHTNPEVWRPAGNRAEILRHPEGLAGLAVGAVAERVLRLTGP